MGGHRYPVKAAMRHKHLKCRVLRLTSGEGGGSGDARSGGLLLSPADHGTLGARGPRGHGGAGNGGLRYKNSSPAIARRLTT